MVHDESLLIMSEPEEIVRIMNTRKIRGSEIQRTSKAIRPRVGLVSSEMESMAFIFAVTCFSGQKAILTVGYRNHCRSLQTCVHSSGDCAVQFQDKTEQSNQITMV